MTTKLSDQVEAAAGENAKFYAFMSWLFLGLGCAGIFLQRDITLTMGALVMGIICRATSVILRALREREL